MEKSLETLFKSVESLFIDTDKQTITEVHHDYNAIFSFEGEFLNKLQWLESRYKHTDCSPYELLNIALNTIDSIVDVTMQNDRLKLAIKYLKVAEETPNMSTYQLANAHKAFADLYFENGFTGSALQHYQLAQSLYPKIAVKRKLSKLLALPKENLVFFTDENILDEPDYSNLISHENIHDDNFDERRQRKKAIDASKMLFPIEGLAEIREKMYDKVQKENNIYDPEFEKELEYRLSKLGDIYKQEFYRNRSNRKPDNILSNRELDLLALESMERSFAYKNSQTTEILSPSITNNEEHLDLSQGLIKSHSPVSKSTQSKKYLYTKWGIYEMPDPYKIVLKRGPRDDLKKA